MTAPVTNEFLMSTELECLTATPRAPREVERILPRLLTIAQRMAPSLPGGSSGFSRRIDSGTRQAGSMRFSPTRYSPSRVGSTPSPIATWNTSGPSGTPKS